ncbi:MAG: HTH domain-containing protein, partial [Oscillospiraceae bacterium]
MDAKGRRAHIEAALSGSIGPVSATKLAQELGVSRQIIVGDVALLRAQGADISATPRGYIGAQPAAGVTATAACTHGFEDMERELTTIVDEGGEAVDVVVEHPV